jgi:hypothetical protein
VYADPYPAEFLCMIDNFHEPFVSPLTEHVTFVDEVVHASVLVVFPRTAVTLWVTDAGRAKTVVNAPRVVFTVTPVGFAGTATGAVPAGSGAAAASSVAVTRMVGEENVKPLALMLNVVLSAEMDVVDTFFAPVESSRTDTENCFVEVTFGPHRHCAVSSGMRA